MLLVLGVVLQLAVIVQMGAPGSVPFVLVVVLAPVMVPVQAFAKIAVS